MKYERKNAACGRPDCGVSTLIDEVTLTFGSGRLDDNGCWSRPCDQCAREWESRNPGKTAWPPPKQTQRPRVFVTQIPRQRDERDPSGWSPRYDVSAAESYGDVVELLSPTQRVSSPGSPFASYGMIVELRKKLCDFCDDDKLLLMGDPALITICFSIAIDANDGRAKMLRWSGATRSYTVVEVDLGARGSNRNRRSG